MIRITRVDPERVKSSEELVRLGLAYVPSQSDRGNLGYVALTRLGESAAVLAAKSTFGPRAEADAKKFSVLDKASARLSEALYHIEDGTREDRFRWFSPGERKSLEELAKKISRLQDEVNTFRDGFGPDREAPAKGSDGDGVTRPRRS